MGLMSDSPKVVTENRYLIYFEVLRKKSVPVVDEVELKLPLDQVPGAVVLMDKAISHYNLGLKPDDRAYPELKFIPTDPLNTEIVHVKRVRTVHDKNYQNIIRGKVGY